MKKLMLPVFIFSLLASSAFAVDLYGKYVGGDGVITISRSPVNGLLAVEIADNKGQCDMALDMRFVRNKLVSEDFPVIISFTKNGLSLEFPREDLGSDCENFGLNKPFRRQ